MRVEFHVANSLFYIIIYILFICRSRSKEKRESVIKKLVRRSRSLPRNIGREKCRETLVPPDFYDINPQHTLIVAQNGE